MVYHQFFVDKTTHTFADELVVFGVARLLEEVARQFQLDPGLTITNCGGYYHLRPTEPLSSEVIDHLPAPLALAPFIRTPKNGKDIPPDAYVIEYEEQRDRVNAFFAARKKGEDDLPAAPHPDWDVFRAINPAALPGYTSLLNSWWAAQAALPDILRLLFDLFSQTPNDVHGAMLAWKALDDAHDWGIKPEATGQQLYNPDQGKGQNKSKSDGLSIGNVKNFWLLEYLKAVGFYDGAMTRLVRGAKDRKTFVFAPSKLDYDQHHQVRVAFRSKMQFSESSTRFDILAALRYTEALIEYHMQRDASTNPWLQMAYNPNKEIAGFRTAFYKDLGNAVATMNLAFIALPGWISIQSDEDADRYLLVLRELQQVTQQFDEGNSDAFTLLQHLRDFVSGDDLRAFFRFTAAFPAYYMGMRERGKYAQPLTTALVERIMMNTHRTYSDVLQSEGFQSVAYAIRQSTVTAQYRKKQGDRKYDVRYGLGQDLLRKARTPRAFIAALSEFIAMYNAENAQVMETRPAPYRKSVQTAHIEEVIAFIEDDNLGAETVANLLVAYGYARVSRDEEEIVEEQESI